MNQTFQADDIGAEKLRTFYKEYQIESNNPYVSFCAKLSTCTISLFTSNKVVFQGNIIQDEIAIWEADSHFKPTDKKIKTSSKRANQEFPQCGSDEVGTGDYFGPVCVCASYVDTNIQNQLTTLNLTDSKTLTDDYIRQIAPKLIEIVPHSVVILDNQKYNEVQKEMNLNAIKAQLHNACYIHLRSKIGSLPSLCIVDQFAEEKVYYHYLENRNEVIHNLYFETKAESKYISVAISSIIARYAFLMAMDKFEQIYQISFPKGAGKNVDEFAKEFVKKYSKDELTKVAKLHFKNTNKI